ncbi:MAG: phosphoserine phosphatase SerB [Methylovirgula sp.]
MAYVATFVSDSVRPALTDELLRRLAQHLPAAEPPQWLDQTIAANIGFTPSPTSDDHAIHAALRETLVGLPIDFILQPRATRRKKLFVADMDSTMIAQECIDELADFVGLRAHVAAITERAMHGEIAFEPALLERVALLRGLSANVITKIIAERISLMPGARTLVQTMRAHGTYTALVSGGFTLFTREIAAMIGFHTHRANVLIIEDGKLAGRVREPVLGMSAKLDALEHFRATQGISVSETLAIGDGANDLAMLKQAGLGVAFHAKPAVAAAAHARIDHCDLTALLYAQGYRRAEFRH